MTPAASAAAAISSVFFMCSVVVIYRVQGNFRRGSSNRQLFFKLFFEHFLCCSLSGNGSGGHSLILGHFWLISNGRDVAQAAKAAK